MSLFAALLALGSLAPPAGPGSAPGDASADPVHMRAAAGDTLPAPPDTAEVEDLVVTAHRVPLPRSALTSQVTVFDREEIEASGASHVQELLESVPGADVARSGSLGDPASLFLRGGESNFVQVLVDGVPVNQAGGDFDFSSLTLDNVARVEVVRGPASVVYGSDAVTGVVQIFTRDGEGPARARASVQAGTFGTLDWDVALSGGGGEASYSLSFSRLVSDGNLEFNDDHRNAVGSARFEWTPDARTDASVSVRYSDDETHFPTNSSGEPVDTNAFRFGENLTVGAEAGRFVTERLEARAQLTLRETEDGTDDRRDSPADTLGFFGFQSQSDFARQRADVRLNYHLSRSTVFTAGAEFENAEIRQTSESRSPFGVSETHLDEERDNLGYYAQAVTEIGALALNAGARLDENEEFGSFETYRVGAAYDLPTGTRIRASYGNAFKEPTFIENFGIGFAVGNPDLAPEESESWEAGLEQAFWNDRVSLSATFFDQRFRNLIQFALTPPAGAGGAPGSEDPVPSFFNVAEADARGVEMETEVRLPGRIAVHGSYGHLDAEVVESRIEAGPGSAFAPGEELVRRPAHTASGDATWRPPSGGSVRVALRWVGTRDDLAFTDFGAERVELPSYTRVDVTLRPPLPFLPAARRDAVTPILRVDNLFDVDYQEVAGFPARGRTILAGLSMGLGL